MTVLGTVGCDMTKRRLKSGEISPQEKFRAAQKARSYAKIMQFAKLKFTNNWTWKQVSEATGVSDNVIQVTLSRHPEMYRQAIDELIEKAHSEVRQAAQMAKIRSMGRIAKLSEAADGRLEKIITTSDQDSVAMTGIKHVHGALGISAEAKRGVTSIFEPDENFRNDLRGLVDTLAIGMAAGERAKQL